MVTLYKMLGVEEDASKEVIEKAFKARMNHPAADDKIKNRLRMAAEILLDDVKREKYNKDLASYRAQELLKSVTTTESTVVVEEPKEEIKTSINDDIFSALNENQEAEKNMTEEEKQAILLKRQKVAEEDRKRAEEELRKKAAEEEQVALEAKKREEMLEIEKKANQKEYEKAVKKQEALDKKERKRAEKEYKEKYQEAYVNELRSRGYNVKYPWTWKRTKNLLITIAVTIVVCFIMWQLPFVREPLIELYEENVIVKMLVNMVKSLLNAVLGIFK